MCVWVCCLLLCWSLSVLPSLVNKRFVLLSLYVYGNAPWVVRKNESLGAETVTWAVCISQFVKMFLRHGSESFMCFSRMWVERQCHKMLQGHCTNNNVTCLHWLIDQGLTSHRTHYSSYRGRFLQVIWPNQQCQSTEGSQLVLQIRLESDQDHSTMLQ